MEVIIIPFAATIKPYTLFVIQDDMADNPRETDENFGTMVCFHSRYDLGDKHGFDTPRDFLHRKLFDMFSSYPSSQYGTNIRNCRAKSFIVVLNLKAVPFGRQIR